MNILALNPGSATLKFGFYLMPDLTEASATVEAAILVNGSIAPIGAPQSELRMAVSTEQLIEVVQAKAPVQAVAQIIHRLLAYPSESKKRPLTIDAVGCRVVHGGARYVEPMRVSVIDCVLHQTAKHSTQAIDEKKSEGSK